MIALFRNLRMVRCASKPFSGTGIFRIVVLASWVIPVLGACSLYSSSLSLTVLLPPAPVHWQSAFPDIEYRIVYPAGERTTFAELRVSGDTGAVVSLPKANYLPILAYPHLPDVAVELPPAGGVYPLDCTAIDTIALSWQHGAPAEVLYRLRKQGLACSSVNVPRLVGEMSARGEGDPWTLDLERICSRLADTSFRVTDIKQAPERTLRVVPGTGSWFLESPFRIPLSAQADGSLMLEGVPLGAHTLFELPVGAVYSLYVAEESYLMIRRQHEGEIRSSAPAGR
jgi:hypothetical protein